MMRSIQYKLAYLLFLTFGLFACNPTLALGPQKRTILSLQRNNANKYDPLNILKEKGGKGDLAKRILTVLSSRGGGTTIHPRAITSKILKTLLFERHTATAMLSLGIFCIGMYAMWVIVEECWYLVAVTLKFEKHLVPVQLLTSIATARVNGWVWWYFLNERRTATLEIELLEREEQHTWDCVLLERVYGTLLGSLLSVFSYITCFLAMASLFYGGVAWVIATFLGSGSLQKNESLQYIAVSVVVLLVTSVVLYRLMDYDMLLRMWDYQGEE